MRVASLAKSAHALLPVQRRSTRIGKAWVAAQSGADDAERVRQRHGGLFFRILRHLGLGGLSLDVLVHNLRGQPLRFRRIRRDSRIEQPPPLLGIGEHGILRLPQSAFANP